MTTTYLSRIAAVGLAAALAGALSIGVSAPASANEIIANDVIASDTTVAAASPAAASVPTARASRPGTITVTNHGGRSVTLFAKGERIRRVLAPGSRAATFTGLTAGRVYTVAVGGEPIGAVVALNRPSAASGLTVRTTATPGTVALSWRHRQTAATGGRAISYQVRATSRTAPPATTAATGTQRATLTGLDPNAVYTFSVTPRNNAGTGRATTAAMSRTLAQATGSTVPTTPVVATPVPEVPKPAPVTSTPGPTPAPPAPAPAVAPAPAPRPTTTTIYLCPEGYVTSGELCQQTRAYTFHTEVLTSPYTYHEQFTQTGTDVFFSADCSTGGVYYANGDRGPGCYRWQPTGYYTTVKDAPPAGYTDDGTQYAKDTQVKDDLPEGFTDNGTEWVRTVAKEAKVVSL
jgi:hypothetical protein